MRNVLLIACLSLLHSGLGQGQALDSLPAPEQRNQAKTCTSCSPNTGPPRATADDSSVITNLDASAGATNGLPDAPSARFSTPSIPFEWDLGHQTQQAITPPPRIPIWDKKMWAAHIVFAGATLFDAEVTHEGLANHRCAEGNIDLGPSPSRKELYMDNLLLQFVPETLFDWVGAVGVRAAHAPRWAWKPVGYEGAALGTVVHLRAGIQWFTHGCM
jgi:hypothetical protein